MKDRAIEFLHKKGYKTGYKEPYTITEKGLIDFMADFAQEQVKLFAIPDVSQQSELLMACLNKLEELGYNIDFEYDKETCNEVMQAINCA